ncbi:competence/damage-inducible protein A [Zavarzinella formosa]|uniref:competence/damage-inducible protein A n=1 Tax=Zavarzinella formosa TaxID=360055 RepID=UPI0002D9BFC6|nr:competence/damage-inducible protein A [Zavarzinella formosa]
MKAEIISIGSEITSGQNLDTNSQWLSRRLAEMGIPVAFHTTVADDLTDNIAVFKTASERADLVLCSGGLGPTQDDLTREVMATVAGVPLLEDPVSLATIQEMFTKRRRVMPDRNRVQALIPQGGEAIYNECGTAPGVWLKIGQCVMAAMPGVPSEMKVMFDKQVKPRLEAMGLTGGVFIQRKINTFGLGESAVEEKLLDLTKRGHVPEVGITVSDAVISLRILAKAASLDEALAQVAPVEATIRERLAELVFGAEDDELQHIIVDQLISRKETVATAESITAGLVANRLAHIPGASNILNGGVVVYTNEMKIKQLDVPSELIATHTAVSAEVAQAMAKGVREKFGTTYGLATTGYAGPTGGDDGTIAGTVFVALATSEGTSFQKFNWPGTRLEVQSRTAKLALNLLRLHLRKTS